MANGLTVGSTTRGTLGSSAAAALSLDLKGNVISRALIDQWKLEGRVYIANRGNETTPISFAKTAFDEDQPALVLRVPGGIVAVPLHLEVTLEDSAGTDNEIIWGAAENDIGNGTSTDVSTKYNLRLKGPAPGSIVRREYTGNSSALTNKLEFYRAVYPFADATTDPLKRFVVEPVAMPILVGEASLILWVAGVTTAPSGFATIVWAEFQKAELGL